MVVDLANEGYKPSEMAELCIFTVPIAKTDHAISQQRHFGCHESKTSSSNACNEATQGQVSLLLFSFIFMSISVSHFKGDIRRYVRQRFRIIPARYMLIVNDRPWLAPYCSPDFLNRPQKANPLKLLESVFFFFIQDSFSSSLGDRSRFSRRRTCCPSLDFAF